MLRRALDIIRPGVSGAIALDFVAGITRFHRIQASPGYRESAHWCARRLEEAGLEVEVLSYPARPSQSYWAQVMFQEWACEEGTLDLVAPAAEARRLCDFRANPLAVIQRSTSTPPGGLKAPVVVVDRADVPASYEGIDVRGRFVLFSGDAQRAYELAVVARGAAGLLTDQMSEFAPVRTAFDLPSATQYASFWYNTEADPPAVGFVLSPAAGLRLRRLIKEAAAGPDPVVLEAHLKGRLYDGAIENVSAVLPGRDALGSHPSRSARPERPAEEVLLVAHLCHPKPSANDNASGAGALLETARVLANLVASGRLPRPHRSIRFLLVPEMTGTYAYLATAGGPDGRPVAALNLDMVGGHQGLCGGGPLQAEYPPLATPDFTGDLLSAVLDALSDEGRSFSGSSSYALFNHARSPFSGGSDHYILSDPTVGVPCPMLIQFPDRFYHTSADTLDKIDPDMLRRAATAAALYLYFLASAGPREAAWLGGVMTGFFARDASRLVDEAVALSAHARGSSGAGHLTEVASRLAFRADRKRAGLRALARALTGETEPAWLDPLEEEVASAATREAERFARLVGALGELPTGGLAELPAAAGPPPDGASLARTAAPADQPSPTGPEPATDRPSPTGPEPATDRPSPTGPGSEGIPPWTDVSDFVPRRVHPGPVQVRPALRSLPPERREFWYAHQKTNEKGYRVAAQLVYWMDGRRTLAEVARFLELETGFRDEAFTAAYVTLLVECRLLRLSPQA